MGLPPTSYRRGTSESGGFIVDESDTTGYLPFSRPNLENGLGSISTAVILLAKVVPRNGLGPRRSTSPFEGGANGRRHGVKRLIISRLHSFTESLTKVVVKRLYYRNNRSKHYRNIHLSRIRSADMALNNQTTYDRSKMLLQNNTRGYSLGLQICLQLHTVI